MKPNKTDKDKQKLQARFLANYGVRESNIEKLHKGIFPSSPKGDFSDVKVVTPYGEIPWKDVSRISDMEMHKLMLDVELKIQKALYTFSELQKQYKTPEEFETAMKEYLYDNHYVSWDVTAEKTGRSPKPKEQPRIRKSTKKKGKS